LPRSFNSEGEDGRTPRVPPFRERIGSALGADKIAAKDSQRLFAEQTKTRPVRIWLASKRIERKAEESEREEKIRFGMRERIVVVVVVDQPEPQHRRPLVLQQNFRATGAETPW